MTKRHHATAPEDTTEIKKNTHRYLKPILVTLALLVLTAVLLASYVYAASPEVIRKPKLEHYHLRMQILVNGKAEDFGSNNYQVDYAKDQCNADLPEQPIHFHDSKDQFVHIHWEGMTGGMVMKYYGWNFIGGLDGALGYKLDKLTEPKKVTIHGKFLPAVPDGANFYIYTGDENGYQERNFEEFKNQDLEQFFGKTSNHPSHELNKQSSLIDKLFPKVSAHGTEVHAENHEIIETEKEKLTRINNLIGNVVIFVQNDKPSDEQIKDRFNKLVPLSESTCGG